MAIPNQLSDTLSVADFSITGIGGEPFTLCGVNLPLVDDWSFPNDDPIAEVAKTGANAVRIQWYINQDPNRTTQLTLDDLDRVLDQCAQAGMVPIVVLFDVPCPSDVQSINEQLIPWWTSGEVVAVLQKHAKYVIINVANEAGKVRWGGDSASFLAAYTTAIGSLRGAGLRMPIMIDAPDCGTSMEIFLEIGKQLIEADPLHNILLSIHAYWAAYDGMAMIEQASQAHLPVIFGEIANKQDETMPDGSTAYGYYDLDGSHDGPGQTNGFTYQALLTELHRHQIGWLAWSWGPDNCDARRMSSDGTFASLTPYGQDIVHNPHYGLATTSRIRLTD